VSRFSFSGGQGQSIRRESSTPFRRQGSAESYFRPSFPGDKHARRNKQFSQYQDLWIACSYARDCLRAGLVGGGCVAYSGVR